MNVKWGSARSDFFRAHNGVKQGGILSPVLFCVYMDDLNVELNRSAIGCQLLGVSFNNFSYADDMALAAPSPGGLQKLLNICERYALSHDMIYNSKKSVAMLVQSKKVKFSKNPIVKLAGQPLKYVDSYKYLGCFISSDQSDDLDIDRQRRWLLINANRIVRKFHKCSEEVKVLLFKTFCCNMYCSHLWSNYKKSTLQKLKVSYHNGLRWLLNLPRDCSASNMLVSRHLPTFDSVRRNYMSGFVHRLQHSCNQMVHNIVTPQWYLSSTLGGEVLSKLFTKNL